MSAICGWKTLLGYQDDRVVDPNTHNSFAKGWVLCRFFFWGHDSEAKLVNLQTPDDDCGLKMEVAWKWTATHHADYKTKF